jgi:riboflavin-specific deaminase-like protein
MSDALEALYASVPPPKPHLLQPFVTLSYAQSLDGSIAAVAGRRLLLSGPRAMNMTHQLRAAHDGILVGIGTVLADNPRLTTRLVDGSHPQPIILDSYLRTPLEAKVLEHPRSVCIACLEESLPARRDALLQAGADLIPLPESEHGYIDLGVLLSALISRGIQSLMVEGGARVITNFLAEELVDLLVLTINSRLVGGLHAPVKLLEGQPKLRAAQWIRLGEDQVVWGALDWPNR